MAIKTDTLLYLIQSGNYLKIGITKDIVARLQEYQTHNPDIKVIAIREGLRSDELLLHHTLKDYLIGSSEWMTYSQEIIDTFNNITLPHSGETKENLRQLREDLNYSMSNHNKNPKNKGKNNGMHGKIPANAKSVIQLDLDGNFIKEWRSAAEAKKFLGIDNITVVCNGKRKQAGGYLWKWGENNYSSKFRRVAQLSLQDELLADYDSCWEAAQCLNLDASSIYKVCTGKAKTCGGFKWMFSNE